MGLKRNILYSSFLTTSLYVFQFITYPYVARVLGVTNIGICNFTQSIVQYFILFSMLGVSSLGIREIAACGNNKQQRDNVFSKIFQLTCLITILVIVIYIACIECVPNLTPYRNLLYVGVLQILFNTLTIEWLFRGLENFKYITIRTLTIRIAYVIAVFTFVRRPNDYGIYFLILSVTYVLNGITNLLYGRKFICFKWQSIKSLSPYLIPLSYLGVQAVLCGMYTSFNTVYLGFVADDNQVGYYTTATKIQGIILGLYSAFTLAMMPRMSICKEKTERTRLLDNSMEILLTFAIPIILITVFFSKEIIYIISGPEYKPASLMLMMTIPLILIIGIRQILVGQILIPNKADKSTFATSLTGGCLGLILNILLVERWKGLGSSAVFIGSEFVVLLSAYYFVRKHDLYKIRIQRVVLHIILWVPFAIACLFAKRLDNSYIGLLCSSILAALLLHINMYYVLQNKSYIQLMRQITHR